jgi:hypothetical protein
MSSQDEDRAYLEAALPELEAYLLSADTYRQLDVSYHGSSLPALSLGNVLLTRARLGGSHGEGPTVPPTGTKDEGLLTQLDELHVHWVSHWEQKAAQELRVRLGLWQDYLEELVQSPSDHASDYGYQVRQRVIIELLKTETGGQVPAEIERIAHLDDRLRALTQPAPFAWEAELQAVFPSTNYWFLYRRPPKRQAGQAKD